MEMNLSNTAALSASSLQDPTSLQGLDLNDKENLKSIGEQFDTILWRNFLQSALKPSADRPGLLKGTGPGSDLQFGLLVDSLAQAMAQGQSLGFDQLLEPLEKDGL
jgi:hypothetical protein